MKILKTLGEISHDCGQIGSWYFNPEGFLEALKLVRVEKSTGHINY